jgi:hypothetical protein
VPTLDVDGFLFDDRNIAKLAEHEVTIREAFEVLEGNPKGFRNHSEGAPWVLVGATLSGRMITLPIDPSDEPGMWRPRTGYDSSNKELRRYEKE